MPTRAEDSGTKRDSWHSTSRRVAAGAVVGGKGLDDRIEQRNDIVAQPEQAP
jgi:hypothetical protein